MDRTDSREQHLKELRNFTDAVNKQIADIVGTLGWTVESVTNVVNIIVRCTFKMITSFNHFILIGQRVFYMPL